MSLPISILVIAVAIWAIFILIGCGIELWHFRKGKELYARWRARMDVVDSEPSEGTR